MKKVLWIVLVVFALSACGQNTPHPVEPGAPADPPAVPKPQASTIPQTTITLPGLASMVEDDYMDLVFALTNASTDAPTDAPTDTQTDAKDTACFTAEALFNKQRVGIEILLKGPWKELHMEGARRKSYDGTLCYRSPGPEGDRLLTAMDEIFGTNINPVGMKPGERCFPAVCVNGNPNQPKDLPLTFKVILGPQNSPQPVELFTDIDWNKKEIHIREKKSQYRERVINILGG